MASLTRPVQVGLAGPPSYEESLHHPTVEYAGVTATTVTDSSSHNNAGSTTSPGDMPPAQGDTRPPIPNTPPPPYSPAVPNRHWVDPALRHRIRRRLSRVSIDTGTTWNEGEINFLELGVPPIHMLAAIVVLILNCVAPGIGTMIGGLFGLCFPKGAEWTCKRRTHCLCINFGLGILQLLTTPILLLGMAWSIFWGLGFCFVSHQEYHGWKEEDEESNHESRSSSAVLSRSVARTTSDEGQGPVQRSTRSTQAHARQTQAHARQTQAHARQTQAWVHNEVSHSYTNTMLMDDEDNDTLNQSTRTTNPDNDTLNQSTRNTDPNTDTSNQSTQNTESEQTVTVASQERSDTQNQSAENSHTYVRQNSQNQRNITSQNNSRPSLSSANSRTHTHSLIGGSQAAAQTHAIADVGS